MVERVGETALRRVGCNASDGSTHKDLVNAIVIGRDLENKVSIA